MDQINPALVLILLLAPAGLALGVGGLLLLANRRGRKEYEESARLDARVAANEEAKR